MNVDCKYMATPTLIHLIYIVDCISLFLLYILPIQGCLAVLQSCNARSQDCKTALNWEYIYRRLNLGVSIIYTPNLGLSCSLAMQDRKTARSILQSCSLVMQDRKTARSILQSCSLVMQDPKIARSILQSCSLAVLQCKIARLQDSPKLAVYIQ